MLTSALHRILITKTAHCSNVAIHISMAWFAFSFCSSHLHGLGAHPNSPTNNGTILPDMFPHSRSTGIGFLGPLCEERPLSLHDPPTQNPIQQPSHLHGLRCLQLWTSLPEECDHHGAVVQLAAPQQCSLQQWHHAGCSCVRGPGRAEGGVHCVAMALFSQAGGDERGRLKSLWPCLVQTQGKSCLLHSDPCLYSNELPSNSRKIS